MTCFCAHRHAPCTMYTQYITCAHMSQWKWSSLHLYCWLAFFSFFLYQPLLFLISSNKSVLKDFTNFARKMSLRYMFEDKRKILAHPFHVKSTWQPPIQNSVALQRYLEETKLELASTVFHAPLDYISANERKAIGSLKRNSEINL